MRVLIACEFSGIVRDAFLRRGHDAWSCDLLPSERPLGPEGDVRHVQGDVMQLLKRGRWDLMIAHPPCTYLAASGLHWNKRVAGRGEKTEEALTFVQRLLDAPIRKIALENPVGCISTRVRKPDQIIQPYQYGHAESKATCLWLENLQPLVPTRIMEPIWYKDPRTGADYRDASGKRYSERHYKTSRMSRWLNQTPSGQNKLGPHPDRWRERSRTYQGIADAMAEQWG